MMRRFSCVVVLGTTSSVVSSTYVSEIAIMPEHDVFNDYSLPLPSTYVQVDSLPSDFSWGDINGTNYLTKLLNQHIPQCINFQNI